MNPYTPATCLILGLVLVGATATAGPQALDDSSLGLSKTSVFDTPTPEAPKYEAGLPGTNAPLPPAYPTAPRQIPHQIEAFLPVTAANNACLGCHNRPALIGQPKREGVATPIPRSHYAEADKLSGARYNCTQCHAPQAAATPLVENTFGN